MAATQSSSASWHAAAVSAAVTLGQDTEGLLAVHDVAGLLGTVFLQRFIVTVDEPRKVLYLSRR
ncbi:MAG TPA: hypothetical protein VF173_33020 [Thermoanaerobaculia bacterium]|nr:hypothetical protein [Thermoanaerobaculia bacterium]